MLYKQQELMIKNYFGYLFLFLIFFILPQKISAITSNEKSPYEINQRKKVRITGTIVDEKGVPLVGATVQVKKSTQGLSVDLDGNFSMDVSTNDILVINFVGYETQEIKVNSTRKFNITMKPSSQQLDEVTVVAFGKQKKESVVGAIATVRPNELKVPSSNLTTALSGRIAGVISYQRSGEPGQDNADFFIRGVTTFGYKVDPLILLDGVEISKDMFSRLDVDDIESFSIMKDASSTALYGSRGANGVILVNTKQGTNSKASFNVRYETSLSTPTQNVDLADPVTYMRLENEAVLTRDPLGITRYSEEKIDGTMKNLDPYLYPSTDWQKLLFKDYTINNRFNMNITGGGSNFRYFISGRYSTDNGILNVPKINDFNSNIKLNTAQVRANVNINLNKTTELRVNMSGTFTDYTGPLSGGSDIYNQVMHTNPVLFSPTIPKEQTVEYGLSKHILFGNYDKGQYINPLANLAKGYKEYNKSNMYAQVELREDFSSLIKGLTARIMVNVNRDSYFDISRQYNPFWYNVVDVDDNGKYMLDAINPTSGTEYLDYRAGNKTCQSSTYMESWLNYNRNFNKIHNVSGLLVFTMRNRLEGSPSSLQNSLARRNMGLAGRFTYGLLNRYNFEVNFGYNGSESFDKKHRFGFFPSAGLAWTISNEKFFTASLKKYISRLKIRSSLGLVGNDQIASDRFFFLSDVNMNDSNRGTQFGQNFEERKNGITINRYANPDIGWEVSEKGNVAVESEFLKGFELIAEYYWEKRRDILMTRSTIPTSMGLSSDPRANVGKAKADGVDISLTYNHFFNKDFWLQGRLNYTYATSKYVKYEEPVYDEYWKSRIGHSLRQSWGYIADRLFIDDEEVANSPQQNFGSKVQGGDIKFHDANGDGVINSLDQVPIGYPTTPEINYGFGFSVGLKNFDLSAFFQGSANSSFWIDVSSTTPFNNNTQLLNVYAQDHWSEENRNIYALWPRLSTWVSSNNYQRSTWFMRDGAFLRFKDLEIGYTFPRDWTRKFRVNKLRLYGSCRNVCLWSKFKLWDVEMAGNGLQYPIQRVFNLGLNMTF